jgi:hypothetical protein
VRTPYLALAALLSLSAHFWAHPLRAQATPAFDLTWKAPAGCPQQAEVRQRIDTLVGAAKPMKDPLRAEGSITQTEDARFRLKLVVRSGELVGERNIESASCADLAGAAAVTLGLLLRSEEPLGDLADLPSQGSAAATEPSSPAPAPRESGETQPERGEDENRSEEGASPSARDAGDSSAGAFHGLVQAPLVALSLGPLPEPSFGLGLAGGVSFANWRFLFEGQKWWEQSIAAEDFPGFGADVERITGTVRGCRELRWQRFAVAPCLTLSIEHVAVSGTGPGLVPSSQGATWLAPGAGVQGLLPLTSWLSLVASIDGRIEASRPQITIEGLGEVTQLGAGAVTVIVGSEWIL